MLFGGTPDNDLGDFGGVPNENEYSKIIIKGKLIKKFVLKKHYVVKLLFIQYDGCAMYLTLILYLQMLRTKKFIH